MCLCLPHVPHHNTIVVEKEEQLQPFRPVTVSFKRRIAVVAPYVPHHNTVVVNSTKSFLHHIGTPSLEYMDDEHNAKFQLEGSGMEDLQQTRGHLETVKNDIVKSINNTLIKAKA